MGRGESPILWWEATVSWDEWLGWAESEEEEELLVPWLDMWWCWFEGLLEVFGEEVPADDEAARAATAFTCSTGPLVIVNSPLDEVVNLREEAREGGSE